MNHHVPGFLQMEDVYSIPTTSRSKRPATGGEGVTELLWENGHVVMQNQRPAKKTASGEVVIPVEREIRLGGEEQQDDEMGSWLQYPLDDLYVDILYPPPPPPAPIPTITQPRVVAEILSTVARSGNAQGFQKFGHFSRFPARPRTEPMKQPPVTAARESAVVESNEMPSEPRVSPANLESDTATASPTTGELAAGTCEQTVTSSSTGGSQASLSASGEAHQPLQRPDAAPEDRKRKARENDDNEYLSEEIEFEAAEAKEKTVHGSTSTKRSRTAEVHNLSERRRRDRINERMRALQELIPRCNKSDKASMLDGAIEYLKSLQTQVEMMSMGCPMVPVMYPGMQQYMPAMGLGMAMNRPMVPYHPSMLPSSSMPNPVYTSPRFLMPAPFPMPQVHTLDPRIQASSSNQADRAVNFSQYQNQPGMPNFVEPYQKFVGMQQGQYSIPQNQAVPQPGANKPSTSKETSNPGSQFV